MVNVNISTRYKTEPKKHTIEWTKALESHQCACCLLFVSRVKILSDLYLYTEWMGFCFVCLLIFPLTCTAPLIQSGEGKLSLQTIFWLIVLECTIDVMYKIKVRQRMVWSLSLLRPQCWTLCLLGGLKALCCRAFPEIKGAQCYNSIKVVKQTHCKLHRHQALLSDVWLDPKWHLLCYQVRPQTEPQTPKYCFVLTVLPNSNVTINTLL